jgi:hypothetical protein
VLSTQLSLELSAVERIMEDQRGHAQAQFPALEWALRTCGGCSWNRATALVAGLPAGGLFHGVIIMRSTGAGCKNHGLISHGKEVDPFSGRRIFTSSRWR